MPSKPTTTRIKDHNELFDAPEFREQWDAKREFEQPCSAEEVARVAEWTRSVEYRERNFAREALTINPEKACQPLGATLAAIGFARTLPLVHGSQGCVAYFRSHFSRHFKEPFPAVSSSMTEEAAVFGGTNNLIEALQNATALYRPEMLAVSTTCMAEVIGDDLENIVAAARAQAAIPDDFPVPCAHTPSFVGSHLTGYDNMLRAILEYLNRDRARASNGKINVVCGFDTNVGDLREIKRILTLIGVDHLLVGDHSESLDSPAIGDYPLYPGGTPLSDAADAVNAIATVFLQHASTRKTVGLVRHDWEQDETTLEMPIGVANTDRFVTEVARLTETTVPGSLAGERGRLVDAMADSHAYLHGKRVAIAGDPDLVVALLGFLLELGVEPVHVLSTNGDEAFADRAEAVLANSPFGHSATVWPGKDLWHLRSLVFTEPVDLLIGSSHLKYLSREADVPLVRVGFPVFDRHHLHRFPIVGYQGSVSLLAQLVNTVLDELDRHAPAPSFDLVR